MKAILTLLAILFAASVEAGPITASASGCVREVPAEGFSWLGSDYLFMVFHDPKAGCEPTTFANTRGLHLESTTLDGLFRVDMPAWLLQGACGRFQVDAHVRVNSGLSQAPEGLQTLVYDTGIDCAPGVFGESSYAPPAVVGWPPMTDTPTFPPETPRTPELPPVSVPESSSAFWLLACGLVGLFCKNVVKV